MTNVLDKTCTENQNTHFMFSNVFPENRAVYEIMWKNTAEPKRSQMTIWRRVSKITRAQPHARARAPTPTGARASTCTHESTHPDARTHTNT